MASTSSLYNSQVPPVPALWTSPMAFFAEFSQKSGPRVHYAFETIGDELRRSVVPASRSSRPLKSLNSFTPASTVPFTDGGPITLQNSPNTKNQQIGTVLDAWTSSPPASDIYSSVSISQPRASTVLDLLEPTRMSSDNTKFVSSEHERGRLGGDASFVAGAKVVWSKTVYSTVPECVSVTEDDHRAQENGKYNSISKASSYLDNVRSPPVVRMVDAYSLLPKEFPKQPSDIIIGKNIVSGSVIRKEHRGVIAPLILRVFDTIEGTFVTRVVPEVGGVAAFKLTLYDIEARGEQRSLLVILTHPSPTELLSRMPILAPFIIAKIQNIKNRSAQVRYMEATTGSSMDVAQRKNKSNKSELRLCLGGSLKNIHRELHDMFEVVIPLTFSHHLAMDVTREHILQAHALQQRKILQHKNQQKDVEQNIAGGEKKDYVKKSASATMSYNTSTSSTLGTIEQAALDFTSNSTLIEEVSLQRIKSDSYLLPPAVILSFYPSPSSICRARKRELNRVASDTCSTRKSSITTPASTEYDFHSKTTSLDGRTGYCCSQLHPLSCAKVNQDNERYMEVMQHIAVAPLSICAAPQLKSFNCSSSTVPWETLMPCMAANTRNTSKEKLLLEVKKGHILTCKTEEFQHELELAASGQRTSLIMRAYGIKIHKKHKIHKSHELITEDINSLKGSSPAAIDEMPPDDHIAIVIPVHVGLATAISHSTKKKAINILPIITTDANGGVENDEKESIKKEISTGNKNLDTSDCNHGSYSVNRTDHPQNPIKKEVFVDIEHHTTILTPFLCMPNPALCSLYHHTTGNDNRCSKNKCGMLPVKPVKPFAAWMLDSYFIARSMNDEGINTFRRGMAPLLTTIFTGRQLYITGDNENICAEFAMSVASLLPEKLQKVKYFSDTPVDPYEANIVSFGAFFLSNCDIVNTADYTQKEQFVLSEEYPRGLVHVYIAEKSASVGNGVAGIPFIQKVDIADEMYYAKHPEAINQETLINAEAMRKAKEMLKQSQTNYSRNHCNSPHRSRPSFNTGGRTAIPGFQSPRRDDPSPSPGCCSPQISGHAHYVPATVSDSAIECPAIDGPFISSIGKYGSQFFSNELKSAKEILDAYDGKVCPTTVLEIIEECISHGTKLEMSCLHDIILYDDYHGSNIDKNNIPNGAQHVNKMGFYTDVMSEYNMRKDNTTYSTTSPDALNTIYDIRSKQMEIWRSHIYKESPASAASIHILPMPAPFRLNTVCDANQMHSESIKNRSGIGISSTTTMEQHTYNPLSIQSLRQNLHPKQIELLLNGSRPLETPYNNEVQLLQTVIEMILADAVIKGRQYTSVYKRNQQQISTNGASKLSTTPIGEGRQIKSDGNSGGFITKIKSSFFRTSSLGDEGHKKQKEIDSLSNANSGNNAVDLVCSVGQTADQMYNAEQRRKKMWLHAIAASTLNIGLMDEEKIPKEVTDFATISDMPDILALLSEMKMSVDRDQGVLMFMGATPSIFH